MSRTDSQEDGSSWADSMTTECSWQIRNTHSDFDRRSRQMKPQRIWAGAISRGFCSPPFASLERIYAARICGVPTYLAAIFAAAI